MKYLGDQGLKISLFFVLFFVLYALFLSLAEATTREVRVAPSVIEVNANEIISWPHTKKLYVRNSSAEAEWVEVRLEGMGDYDISVQPSQFALEGNSAKAVSLVMAESLQEEIRGIVKVSASRATPEGLAVGAGIEIPFLMHKERDSQDQFLFASLGEFFDSNEIWLWIGAAGVLLLMCFWKLSKLMERLMKTGQHS